MRNVDVQTNIKNLWRIQEIENIFKAPLIQSCLTFFDLFGARVSAVLKLFHSFVDVIDSRLHISHFLG